VRVELVRESSPELVEAMARLVPQLSSSASDPTESEISALVDSESAFLLLARSETNEIVGMLTLALVRIPTGLRAWIEDVVVDERARGAGIGSALVSEAIAIARGEGARTVDLTSRPDRAAANRLYERLGFARRETNVYRFNLGDPDR
jgi:ribosomal protein S18 acetylase RimI-like enzyme